MEFDISTEKNITIKFKENVKVDEVLFEIVNKNPGIMLSCYRNVEKDNILFFDNIGTKSLIEYYNDTVFSSDTLQQMLLDMIQTLKILIEHGFKEEMIVLDPRYVYISIYDKRPKFVCIPCACKEKNTDKSSAKKSPSMIAEFFRKIIYNVRTANAYSLIGVVLEETSKKKFSIAHFETQMEQFVDVTMKDIDKGYSKALLIGLFLPIATGALSALMLWMGFKIATSSFIDFEIVAYFCVSVASVLISALGFFVSKKPKRKNKIERKEIKYNFSNLELESMREEQNRREEADRNVREIKAEHIDLNTAISNAIIKSGVITIDIPKSAGNMAQGNNQASFPRQSVNKPGPDDGSSSVQPDYSLTELLDSSENAERKPQNNSGSVNKSFAGVNANVARAGSAVAEAGAAYQSNARKQSTDASGNNIAYVPRTDIRRIDDVERQDNSSNEAEKTNLLNFNNEPLPQKRYVQSVKPYLVSIKHPDKKFVLNKEKFTVGSSDDCDLIIKVETVSRHHAVITVSAIGCNIVDNSTNGTYINNVRINRGVPTAVKNGDVISFNRESFKFLDR